MGKLLGQKRLMRNLEEKRRGGRESYRNRKDGHVLD
jgi:hypothetical protein